MQHEAMTTMWNVQAFDQGDLISCEILEKTEVDSTTQKYEQQGYEVRSEPAWRPVKADTTPGFKDDLKYEQATIREALGILETRLQKDQVFSNPSDVKHFCQLHISREVDEYFCCLFLDSQHRLIAFEKLFRGTVDGASVYPRVVVRRALELNAAALILTHNHPSGVPEPSQADRRITTRLKDALALVDVRVLDHVIVGLEGTSSMAETGLI